MTTVESLSRTVNQLKEHIDCLLIRVSSCQEYIQKILNAIGDCYSPLKNKKGQEQISFDTSSPKKKGSISKYSDPSIDKQIQTPTSKNFILFPNSKQMRVKQLETNSFTLMKNAILINSHQIQNLQNSITKIQSSTIQRIKKTESAVEILTNVVKYLDEKLLKKQSLQKISKSPQKRFRLESYRSFPNQHITTRQK